MYTEASFNDRCLPRSLFAILQLSDSSISDSSQGIWRDVFPADYSTSSTVLHNTSELVFRANRQQASWAAKTPGRQQLTATSILSEFQFCLLKSPCHSISSVTVLQSNKSASSTNLVVYRSGTDGTLSHRRWAGTSFSFTALFCVKWRHGGHEQTVNLCGIWRTLPRGSLKRANRIAEIQHGYIFRI